MRLIEFPLGFAPVDTFLICQFAIFSLKFSTGIEKFRELAHAAAIELEKRLEHNAIDVQSGSKCEVPFRLWLLYLVVRHDVGRQVGGNVSARPTQPWLCRLHVRHRAHPRGHGWH